MVSINLEKQSRFWIGLFIIVMSLIYILVSFGKTDWTRWIAVVWGFFLVGLLFIEGGIVEYFRQKKYQSIGLDDFLVWLTIIVGVTVLVNTILLTKAITISQLPEFLQSYLKTTGVISGIVAGVLGIAYMFTGKPSK